MKSEQSLSSSHRVSLQLSQDEFNDLQGKLLCSGHAGLSDYLRDLIRHRSMGTGYRNQSIDEFLGVVIGLKNELNAIGKNLNQAVRRLHQDYYHPSQNDTLEFYNVAQISVLQKIEEINAVPIGIHENFQIESPPKEGG